MSLDADDLTTIAEFSDPSRTESMLLRQWARENGVAVRENSESGIVRVLVKAGAATLRERALAEGYAELAKEQEDGRAEQRARRRRYVDEVDRSFDR